MLALARVEELVGANLGVVDDRLRNDGVDLELSFCCGRHCCDCIWSVSIVMKASVCKGRRLEVGAKRVVVDIERLKLSFDEAIANCR